MEGAKWEDYSVQDLQRLHSCLYDILAEFVRVCDQLGLDYMLLGGSAIGAWFWKGIIPFDDDIDVGMTRQHYDRFLREAPHVLGERFFLQWPGSEPHTPLPFAKLRLNDTCYMEELTGVISMHHGIFIDILPLDKIPDSPLLRKWQLKCTHIVCDLFTCKEIWRYRFWGKCQTDHPLPHGWLHSLFNRIVKMTVPKRVLYQLLHAVQTAFNHTDAGYYNTLPAYCDLLPVADATQLQEMPFGTLTVKVPSHLEEYLHRHYPTLKKHLSDEERARYSHRPLKLSFESC